MRETRGNPFDVEPHLGAMRRYALVLTRDADRAEDLVQAALVRAIAGASSWQAGRELRPWLLSIVHNVHVSHRRRAQVEAVGAKELAATAVPAAPATQHQRVELGQTMEALLTLPEEQREAIVLVAVDGLSYKDAAEILGLPLGTLMSRLARGREALRRALAGGVGDGERRALRVVR